MISNCFHLIFNISFPAEPLFSSPYDIASSIPQTVPFSPNIKAVSVPVSPNIKVVVVLIGLIIPPQSKVLHSFVPWSVCWSHLVQLNGGFTVNIEPPVADFQLLMKHCS